MNNHEELEDKINDIYLLMKHSAWLNDEASEITKVRLRANNTIRISFQDGKHISLLIEEA